MKAHRLDARELDLLKYNADELRVPAGHGRESGEWTFEWAPSGPADSGPKPIVLAAGTKNPLKPHPDAEGPHSTFRRDPKTGVIQNYQTYQYNDIAKQYVPVLRYRGTGGPHGDVDPPFILEPESNKGLGSPRINARPALPEEIPIGGGGDSGGGGRGAADPFRGLTPEPWDIEE